MTQYPPEGKGSRETLKWSYYRGELTLHIVSAKDSFGLILYEAHPWRKIK